MPIEIKLKGLKDLERSLNEIPVQLKKTVIGKSLREGAKIFQKQARSMAPRKTGRLRRAIKVKVSRIHNKPRSGKFGVYIKINPGKKRNDKQGAYYGQFVDGGTSKMQARRFMLNSWGKRTQATAFSIKAMERGVDTVKRRLGF